MTKVIISHKKFIVYITILILWAIPLVMDVPSGTYEIIWLISIAEGVETKEQSRTTRSTGGLILAL